MKLFKDQRGSSNAFVFVILFVLSVSILIFFIEPIKMSFSQYVLNQSYRKGLDKMQQRGGLTNQIEVEIKNYLERFGFEQSKINVNGTIAEVNWGDEITLEIEYELKYKSYNIRDLIVLQVKDKTMELNIRGSTVSYFNKR